MSNYIVEDIDNFINLFDITNYSSQRDIQLLENELNTRGILLGAGAMGKTYKLIIDGKDRVVKKMALCVPENVPVPDITRQLCGIAQGGDLVFRVPVTQNNKTLVLAPNYVTENLVGLLITKSLKKYTPSFVKNYAFYFNRQNPEKTVYSIAEMLEKIEPKINTELDYIYMMFQLMQSLSCAQKLNKFTHFDLHNGNLMCRNYNANKINCYEIGNGQYLYTNFSYDTAIIDFGFSRMEFKENILAPRATLQPPFDMLDRFEFNPYYDVFTILYFSYMNLTGKNQEVFKGAYPPYNLQSDQNKLTNTLNISRILFSYFFNNKSENITDAYIQQYLSNYWRPDPKKLVSSPIRLSTPTEMLQKIASYIKQILPQYNGSLTDKNSIVNYINQHKFFITNVYINLDGIIFFKSPKENIDYSSTPLYKFVAKDTDKSDYFEVLYSNDIRTGLRSRNNQKMLDLNIRKNILPVNYTVSNSMKAGIRDFNNQNIHVLLIDQEGGIKNGYKFKFDCCGSDQRNYFTINSKIDSGATINSTFFYIRSTFEPVGYYKTDDILIDKPIPKLFESYYGVVGISDKGLLEINSYDTRYNYSNVLSCGAILVKNGVKAFDYNMFNLQVGGKYLFVSKYDEQNPNLEWYDVGHGLVKNVGKIDNGELYHASNPNPRSALGITRDNKVVFIHVEGRDNRGVGMDFDQLADLCLSLGLKDAINLDGGGSSKITWKKPGQNIVNVAGDFNALSAYPVGGIIGFVRE